MSLLRRLFATRVGPDLFGARSSGSDDDRQVFTFGGQLPPSSPRQVEMILLLLLLAVPSSCTAVGRQ